MLTEADVKQAMTDSGVTTDVSNLRSEQAFSEYGLDSLDLFNLFVELEGKTGVTVPDEDLDKLTSINDVLVYFNKS
ncbi:MAG: acyl carrier protein [Alteromonas macleodii]|tara:strand:+ start:4391 stop:4618 length:228 start_codon:yes stop_codon:yes gene_type:complete